MGGADVVNAGADVSRSRADTDTRPDVGKTHLHPPLSATKLPHDAQSGQQAPGLDPPFMFATPVRVVLGQEG